MPRAAATDDRAKLSRELGELLVLALPLIAVHAGNQMMSLVDTAMVGRLGPAALAGVGIGNGLYFTFSVIGMGCVLGMDALVAQAVGAGELAGARRILWQGMRVALQVGLPLTLLVGLSPLMLAPLAIAPAITDATRWFLIGRMANVLPLMLTIGQRSYLQARGVVWPVIVAMAVANVANFLGDALLIYGDGALRSCGLPGVGLPALGVLGAGLSSSAATWLAVGVLGLAVSRVPTPDDPRRRHLDRAIVGKIFWLGAPAGMQLLAEVGVFAVVGVLAGRMSAVAAAGHQIALTLASFTFTVTIGISAAASVRVGLHVGRGDERGARRAGLLGLMIASAFMLLAAQGFLSEAAPLARLLSNDGEVVAAAVPLITIAALFQISDGLQSVASGALRGAGDPHVPLLANLVGHYAIALPVAIALGFWARMGAPGLWWGLLTGLTAVAVGLTLRFLRVTSRPIARV